MIRRAIAHRDWWRALRFCYGCALTGLPCQHWRVLRSEV